jgi:hypothetical protein
MICTGMANCSCGCCAGTSVQTPQREYNRSGLSALSYRVGTWAAFKESMLARLSSADYPALQPLQTRSDDDFTIAFLDASAMVLDILTFYQERLVNEHYLRTATQLRSLTELSRLIGYQPAPGGSASTYLAFTLRQTSGQPPDPTAAPLTIPSGTQVQSVPAQGQTPQTFETSAPIQAKPDWNALQVQTGVPWVPRCGDTSVYLAGISTQLQPGDVFVIVGDERASDSPTSEQWDIQVVATVAADSQHNRTYITWDKGLGAPSVKPAQMNPKFYAFRQRAALFGYNAVQPLMLNPTQLTQLGTYLNNPPTEWNFLQSQSPANQKLYEKDLIDLDAVYPKIVPDGWIALIMPNQQDQRSPAGEITLYKVQTVTTIARSDFALSAKISRVAIDVGTHLDEYYEATRTTSALVQSEQLTVAEQPLNYPLYGTRLSLETLRTDMASVQVIALSGTRQKLALRDGVGHRQFSPRDGSLPASRCLQPGEILTLTDPTCLPPITYGCPPFDWASDTTKRTLCVEDANGRPGTVRANLSDFRLAPADQHNPKVTEYALVVKVDSACDSAHTVMQLASPLTHCYDRTTTTVNANVGLATHGQSVSEILGSGNAATPDQHFTLKQTNQQAPLTFVQAPTPTGRQSTLQVQVNGMRWTEVASLYQQSPAQQVYTILNQADGTTDVLFGGDGEGAVLPTGQNNVHAHYRIGSGAAGNVGAGTLTTLMDRPLGVSGVTNPAAATGGQDPQSVNDIRANAPQTVLTLGRAVSITDYQNYASTFPGIAKAYAIWIPSGPGRGVFLTVAGVDGAALPAGSPTLTNLITALRSLGNPLIPITVQTYAETFFRFTAGLQYDPAYDQPTVEGQVRQALAHAYGFAARSFGQAVSIDEIATVIQGVAGVVAVHVTGLTREHHSSTGGDLATTARYATIAARNAWMSRRIDLHRPFADATDRLCAYLPVAQAAALPQPAEILVLDPDPSAVVLGVMS